MPNWSHGLAGVAGTLAAASVALDRPDLAEVATARVELRSIQRGTSEEHGLVSRNKDEVLIAVVVGGAAVAAMRRVSTHWVHNVIGCKACSRNLIEQWQEGLEVVAIYNDNICLSGKGTGSCQATESGAKDDNSWL